MGRTRKIYSNEKSALINAHRRVQLGYNISKHRTACQLTQEKLGLLVGLTRTSIVNIEQGRQQPPITSVPDFCKHLKCSYLELFKDF